jgi:hypothetical protein
MESSMTTDVRARRAGNRASADRTEVLPEEGAVVRDFRFALPLFAMRDA